MRRGMPAIWELIKPLVIYYIGYYVVRIAVGTLLAGSGMSFLFENGSAVVNGIAMLGGCIVLFPMIDEEREEQQHEKRRRKAERKALEEDALEIGTPEGERRWKADAGNLLLRYLALAVFAAASCVFFNALMSLSGLAAQSAAFRETAERQYAVPLGMGLFLYAGVSAVSEEVVFRFLLYNRLLRSCGRVPYAVFGSAFLFAAYHGNMVQNIYAFVLGLLIAYSYFYFDSFAAPVLFHSVGNAVIFLGGMIPEAHDFLFSPAMFCIFGLITAAGCLFVFYRRKISV